MGKRTNGQLTENDRLSRPTLSQLRREVIQYKSRCEELQAELDALVKTRDEGRVVELAVDENVFIVQDGHIYQFRVYDYSLVAKNNGNTRFWGVCENNAEIDDLDFWADDIGKTVFLTRAEAEAALGGGGDG